MRGSKRGTSKAKRRWLVRMLINKHGGLCVECGVAVTFEENAPEQASVDHITPVSKGGTNALSNLQLMCCKCNSGKGDS